MCQRFYDVLIDLKLGTVAAHNWPARNLSKHMAARLSLDADPDSFKPCVPKQSEVHHCSPTMAGRIRASIAQCSRCTTGVPMMKNSLALFVVVDGEVDAANCKNQWMLVKLVDEDGISRVRFMPGGCSNEAGTDGMLNAFADSFERGGIDFNDVKSKLAGVAHDGTSANTGRLNGLGKKTEQKMRRSLVKLVCTTHSASLACKEMFTEQKGFSVLAKFLNHVLAIKRHYNTSEKRWSQHVQNAQDMKFVPKRFGKCSSVRMAPHLLGLLHAIESTHPCTLQTFLDETEDHQSDANTRRTSSNMLNQSLELNFIRLLGFVHDLTVTFSQCVWDTERRKFTFADVPKARDRMLNRLQKLKRGPLEAGAERRLEICLDVTPDEDSSDEADGDNDDDGGTPSSPPCPPPPSSSSSS